MDVPNQVVKKIISPIEKFLHLESSGGIALIFATVLALAWANSPWAASYHHFVDLPITIGLGHFSSTQSIHYWVNDGLMVIFFFVVGLEIKRELLAGELSTPKKAALPMFAAVGGMVFPALIYTMFNFGQVGASGWGIPMATDIAFAVGILTLMGRKAPFSLKVFLLALAIVDDLGAVLVIAFFYTNKIVGMSLGAAVFGLGLMYVLRYAGVRKHFPYIVIGILVWVAILQSGVHATVAGVLIGLLTPIQSLYPLKELGERMNATMMSFLSEITSQTETRQTAGSGSFSKKATQDLKSLHHYVIEAESPLERCIHVLHPWVTYLIMPVFALVNAGVDLHGIDFAVVIRHEITIGIILGLLVGKPIGVVLLSMAAVKLKLAELPRGVTWAHVTAVGFLAGIGFTMALFISNLALRTEELEVYSKVGILVASLIAGTIGSGLLALTKDQPTRNL